MTEEDKQNRDSNLWITWLNSYLIRLKLDYSMDSSVTFQSRLNIMQSNNPRLVLRNHIAEELIKVSELGDGLLKVKQLLNALSNPFDNSSLQYDVNNIII